MSEKKLSILFIGDMCFDLGEYEMNDVDPMTYDGDGSEFKFKFHEKCDSMTYIENIDFVMTHEDTDYLMKVGEDFIEGTNETGENPNEIQLDAYFVDTIFSVYSDSENNSEDILVHENAYSYTKDNDGDYIIFDDRCRVVFGASDEEEVLQYYPKAKKIKHECNIDSRILKS